MKSDEGTGPVRKRVIYAGRVQGVGFRATTHALAADFRVSGCVRNLSDGSVELEAEGSPPEVARFLDAIAARLGRNIQSQQRTDLPSTGDLGGFIIDY